MRQVTEILAQRRAGLISDQEAFDTLDTLAKQAQFNADYSDSPPSYFRWTRIAGEAQTAATSIRGLFRRRDDRAVVL